MKTIFLFFLFILFIIFLLKLPKFIESYQNIPVDIVYTWVEEYDPERIHYQKLLLKKNDFNLDPSRYDQSDELRYSIRSIEKNCPWFRKIYIVVKDGQIPKFINFDNERIILVNHSEIMPKTSLPTFNSLSIETCIHKIKGLSDFYIYMNDDLFITNPLSVNHFIKNNLPLVNIVPGSKELNNVKNINNEYDYGIMYDNSMSLANKITSQNIQVCPTHTPSICYKPWDIELENILKNISTKNSNYKNIWDYTVHSKFRKNDNVAINGCIRPIFYIYKGAQKVNYFNQTQLSNLDGNCSLDIPNHIYFLCVNKISPDCKKIFQNVIYNKFFSKSSFEK